MARSDRRIARCALAIIVVALVAACDTLLGADFDVHARHLPDAGAKPDAMIGVPIPDARVPSHPMPPGRATEAGVMSRRDAGSVVTPAPDATTPDARSGDPPHEGGIGPDSGPRDVDGAPDARPDTGTLHHGPVFGVFPNPPLSQPHDPPVRSAVLDLAATGVHMTMPWADFFFTGDPSCDRDSGVCVEPTCEGGPCPLCPDPDRCYFRPSANPACRQQNYDELECWLRASLDWWTGQSPAAPMSLLLTMDLHGGGAGDFRLGPPQVARLQTAPADMNDARVLSAFRTFYDRVALVLADPVYAPFIKDITLSLGDQVNEYFCSDAAWDAYRSFFTAARAYILKDARRPSMPIRVGSTTSYVGMLCPGVWDFTADIESVAAPQIRALDALGDVVLLSYFPVDRQDGGLALAPERAAMDLAHMSEFRLSLPVESEAARPPLVLAEVGYPTAPDLHDKADHDARYSHFGPAYATPEAAQRVFLQSLLAAMPAHTDVAGLYWWSLFDIPEPVCSLFTMGSFGPAVPPSVGRVLCTSGLSPGVGMPEREVWGTYRARQ